VIRDVQTFKILLFIPSQPDAFFALRESIILFILVSVAEMVLIPVSFLGNALLKMKRHHLSLPDGSLDFQ
jgi:hypothetical protein